MRVLVALEHLWDDDGHCVICDSTEPDEKCLAQWGDVLEVSSGRLTERPSDD